MLVCMYVCQPKIVKCQFFYVFFPNSSLKDNFQNRGFEPYWIVSWVQGVSKCQYMYVCVGLKKKATDLSLNPWQPYIKMNECSFTLKILVLIE